MQKLASEFKKTIIITKQERTILGRLEDIILNPQNGKAIGLMLTVQDKKNKRAVVNTSDIAGIGTNFIMVYSIDNISPPDEIIRIREILDLGIKLVNSSVVDEDGRYLGKVRDWSVNLKTMYLARLYVVSSSLVKMFAQDIIIPKKDIIKIEKDKIMVRGSSVKSGKKITNAVKSNLPAKAETAHFAKHDHST
jgi:sporulation protein YlmC with PRC-barrel domain